MKCENIFCVYNKDNECITEPEIGINGFCEACIYVDAEREYLDKLKAEMLEAWDEQDG